MKARDDEAGTAGRKVSRRWVLRSTAAVTTGIAAAASAPFGAATPATFAGEVHSVPRDHDPETGEIFDRDRHHRWDTV